MKPRHQTFAQIVSMTQRMPPVASNSGISRDGQTIVAPNAVTIN